jgi:ABC-type Fe3+ transport system permease subunit
MFVFRGLHALTRGCLGLLTVVPVVALVLGVFVDRGPAGEARLSFFPAALLALDPFVWTCARNSLIFAGVVTASSLIVGVGLGCLVSRLRFWGRAILRGAAASLLAAPPLVLALGLLGIWGAPYPWPWPFMAAQGGTAGVSLETWRGLPLWLLWIWSSLPGAVALVMLATASAVERLEPAWEDAARLAGAGSIPIWRSLIWPLIRPTAARAAALVFPLALLEPGAVLILGLRRTIAFQIVEAARRADPFPRMAVWAVLSGLLAMAGRALIRRWGGPSILDRSAIATAPSRDPRPARRASALRALLCTMALAGTAALGWLPVLGLFRLVLESGSRPGTSTVTQARSLRELSGRLLDSPVPQLVWNSLSLGVVVASGILIVAWLVRPGPHAHSSRTDGSRRVRPIALMLPLLQGVGILALPWLVGLVSSSLGPFPRWEGLAARLGDLSVELNTDRNPWGLLVCAVGLTVGIRLLQSWQRAAESESDAVRSGIEAAMLAGISPARAPMVAAWRPGRWFGRFLLAAGFAATCLTPALFFTPWIDGRTIAPGILILAAGPDDARQQAAVLGLMVLAVNTAALIAARLTSASPGDGELDRL